MNKSDLVEVVAEETGINKREAEVAVTAMMDSVMSDVRAGNKVSLFGFGTFVPTKRSARTGRNPQTGEPVKIAASKGVRFAPSSAFKQALNGAKAAKGATKRSGARKSGPAKRSNSARRPGSMTKTTAKKAAASRKR